jgi:hypothetical protein
MGLAPTFQLLKLPATETDWADPEGWKWKVTGTARAGTAARRARAAIPRAAPKGPEQRPDLSRLGTERRRRNNRSRTRANIWVKG